MSFKNVFSGGSDEAASAEESAGTLSEDIPDDPGDPRIVKETSPEALNVMGNVLTPLFQNFQTVAADQREQLPEGGGGPNYDPQQLAADEQELASELDIS